MMSNRQICLHGLRAAASGASGTALVTIVVAPDRFNLTSLHGLGNVLLVALVSGLMYAGASLAKSPLDSTIPSGVNEV